MTEDKYNFIFDPKISVSDKRLLMCFANYWNDRNKANVKNIISHTELVNEFEKMVTHHAKRGYMIGDLNAKIAKAKSCRWITLKTPNDSVYFYNEYCKQALNIDEKFTSEDYKLCTQKNIEHAPSYASYIAKKNNQVNVIEQTKTTNESFLPKWIPEQIKNEDTEDKHADVYMIATSILERLHPLLLNVIYEELKKEVKNAP